jgi:hypothetical protein
MEEEWKALFSPCKFSNRKKKLFPPLTEAETTQLHRRKLAEEQEIAVQIRLRLVDKAPLVAVAHVHVAVETTATAEVF